MSRRVARARDLAREATRETTGHPVHETPAEGPQVGRRRVPPLVLWYGVVGGPIAWAVHLGTAWSVSELSCLASSPGGVLLHGGSLTDGNRLAVWGGTVLPWLAAVAAVAACAFVTRRRRALRDDPAGTDELAAERVGLLLVLGWFLSLMSLAAITGGAIALAVLDPCS
jgi:hypothetical protein